MTDKTTVFKATGFATKAHNEQCRKGTQAPYIAHPLGVAQILARYRCSEEIIAAAILHDTVEDTSVTLEDVKKEFGDRIADLVEAASEPDKSKPWRERKEHTIEHLKTAPIDVLLVSCADKLDNIGAIRQDLAIVGDEAWSRFNSPKADQEWYYRSLAKVFLSRKGNETFSSMAKQFAYEIDRVFGAIEDTYAESEDYSDYPEDRDGFKYDPKERNQRYRSIIKKAEEEAEELVSKKYPNIRKMMGGCHAIWGEQKRILKEKYDIDWKTPKELNPLVLFD